MMSPEGADRLQRRGSAVTIIWCKQWFTSRFLTMVTFGLLQMGVLMIVGGPDGNQDDTSGRPYPVEDSNRSARVPSLKVWSEIGSKLN